jgi:hypothetical protein
MMKLFYLLAGCIFLLSLDTLAQTTPKRTGAQYLRQARSSYDQGRLHEIPIILEEQMNASNSVFTQSEKTEAYTILILTYIYLEEPEKADSRMISLLRLDKFFKPKASDPIEFKTLWKKFRREPLFRVGIKIGGTQTHVNTMSNYRVTSGNGEYVPNVALQFGASFEKDFMLIRKADGHKRFAYNPEIFYSTHLFTYKNENLFFNDNAEASKASLSNIIKQQRIQLNLLLQYTLIDIRREDEADKTFIPYVAAGPTVGYLMKSTVEGETIFEDKFNEISSGVDNTEHYSPFSLGLTGSLGFKWKIGDIYVNADLRYQQGFLNIVNEEKRKSNLNPDLQKVLWNLTYINNDFSLNHAAFNIGIVLPFFSPKKLIK